MSQFNQLHVPTLSADQFILRGQRWNLQGANIGGVMTSSLTTQVIINDDTKNQALFEEIYGNIHGNTFPALQAEIDALEANVLILQGDVVNLQSEINVINGNITSLEAEDIFLQSQINMLSGNVVINANAIAELINDTQFLEAPYAGLSGNTSFFWRGLQVYNTPTDTIDEANGTGIFSYLDGGNVANQIQLRVQDAKNVLIAGGSQQLKPKSTGNVQVNNTDGNFNFLVGDRTLPNFQTLSKTEINGAIDLKGEGNTAISIYTQPAQVLPLPIPAIKRCDMRGGDETRIFGGAISATGDSGGTLEIAKSVRLFTPGGSAPGSIDLQIGSCDTGTTGKINIGTEQGLTETGFKEIYIGQNGPPQSIRKSSTFLDGDSYLPQNLLLTQNLGGWDNITYLGLPTTYSGPLRGPIKNTYSPYVKSISTFSSLPTINSFIQSSGTFTVAVGLGAISMSAGAGGCLINTAAGLLALTSLIGGIGLTTAGGAIALTTGAGIIQMTTGAAPIAMETNYGDILLKAGYSNQSTPQLSIGSVYLQARNYTYITPDQGVIIGEGIVTPFNETLLNTMNYPFSGNLFSNAFIANLTGIYSNIFISPNSITTLLNPVTSNLIYSNTEYETGTAYALLRNMDINGTIATSSLATVPSGNLGANVAITNFNTNFFFPDNTVLPLNANVKVFVYIPDTPNISNYRYSTWQANANIASNISGLVNAYVEPLPPVYDNYMTVLGNVGILSDLDVGANITVASSSFPLQQTLITRNSITTTGDITCSTLNYTTLNPPIVIPNIGGGGVDSIIAGTNISISPLSGLGNVIINCTLPNIAGVSQIVAGNGIQISPIIGTGVVTVELAGSVIPPGGYLPINGGTMTGSIYQFPSSNLFNNTVKKYRPVSSYQPPYPSIGPPSFTGELLTFYNGDNPPVQEGFTGWFTQNLIDSQPTVITEPINIDVTTKFYQTVGGTAVSQIYVTAQIDNFKVGDHLQGGYFPYAVFDSGAVGGPYFQIVNVLNGNSVVLYKVQLTISDGGPSFTNLPEVDFIYTAGQQVGGTNYAYIYSSIDPEGLPHIDCNMLSGNWEGYLNLATAKQSSFMAIDNILYEYFNDTNTIQKLLVVNGTGMGQPPKIFGITTKQVATTNLIYIYGIFQTVNVLGTGDVEVNNVFQYNVNTNVLVRLTATTASANAYGVNNAVYGVDVSDILNKSVFLWGDFTGSGAQGGVVPGDTNINCGFSWTDSNVWTSTQGFGVTPIGTEIGGCRGGIIVQDYLGSPNTTALLLYAQTYNVTQPLNTITSAVVTYGALQFIGSSAWPFGNPPPSTGGINSGIVSKMQIVSGRVIFMGDYIGSAWDGSNYVNSYSISSCLTNGTFSNGIYLGVNFEIYAGSNNGTFWTSGTDQITVNTVQLQSNNTLIIGTNGYKVAPNGGGVMVYTLSGGLAALPVKQPISAMLPYSVNSIIGNTASAVQLTCSLNINNFFFSQTFNSTNPLAPATTPTVNAINGAKFAVASTEMDKIVFSGSDTDFASVSFIAGDVEDGDKYWYWQAQVGLIDYYDGATFYPNVSPSGTQTTPNIAQVLAVGNNALAQNLSNVGSISSASATITYATTPSLDATLIGDILTTGLSINPDGNLRIKGAITKGSLLAGDGTNTIEFPTTSNNLYLKTNSSTSSGLEWASINGVASITPGLNIGIDNTIPNAPVVSLLNPLTSNLNLGTQFVSGTTGYINFVAAATSEAQMSALLGFQSYDALTSTTQTSLYKTGLTTSTFTDTLVVAPTSITKSLGSTTLAITSTASPITITPLAGNDLNVVVSGAGSTHITQSTTGGASQPMLELENTNGGANGGHMDFYKNSASPALDDVIGAISLHANNASATKVEYARISAAQRQTTAGSENGSVSVFCCSNSPTPTEMIRFNGDGQTGTGSIDTYKPFNISTNTIIGSTGSINLVNGLFTSILTSTNLRVQDTTTTTTQTQITKTALTVATLGINTVYGLASIITTGSTNFAITNTSFSLNLTGSGMLLNSGANLIQITQPLNGVTKLSTDRPGHKFYPDYVIDNSGQNTVTVPAPEIINQRLTIVNYGLTQNNVWASYGDSYGNGVNFIFRDSNSRVWVANDAGLITIRDDTLNTPDLQTIQVGGGATQIYIIYESAGYVYIGGNFSNVDGNPQLQYSISRFDISSFPYSFSPMFGGFQYREGVQGSVFAISDIGAGNLIIGGNFTLFSDSNPCNYICVISSAQSAPSSQTFTEYAGGTNGTIQALLYDSAYNYLWVGGSFTSVQGGAFVRNYCSAYGVINLTWDEVAGNSLNSNVNCITLTSFGQIFLAGDFPALPSGQNYSTYIDRSNPAVYNDTNLGGVPNFSQRNLAFYDGNFGVLNAGGVWVNTSQLVWVFIENPTSAAVPASGIPLCITIWSGNWKVGYSTTSKVYAHTLLPDSCNFNGNYKYGVGVHTTATLTNENTSQQFIGDPTCSFWIPIGTPINSFS
jgi:hypothetical protein